MVKCIYCNTEEDLNISHIVPESLTNAMISRKNVCDTRHNNNFSDAFENDVISSLSYLRNRLGIANKRNKQAFFSAVVEIDGVEYEGDILNVLDFFDGALYKSKDQHYLFGDFEKLKAIADKKGKEAKIVDLEAQKNELKIPVNITVFFSLAMRRLAAKMAYEWLCSLNDINEKFDEFSNLIEFIESGNDDQYVTYVTEPAIYRSFSEFTENGSHTFLAFEDKSGQMQVLINLFGICLFNVSFPKNLPSQINHKFGFLELQVTAKKIDYTAKDFSAFASHIEDNVVYVGNALMLIPYHPLLSSTEYRYGTAIIKLMKIAKKATHTQVVEKKLVDIVVGNLNTLFRTSVLHIRMLKRFAKEQVPDSPDLITLNLQGASAEAVVSYYILYLIGQKGKVPENHSYINSLISEILGEGETIVLNDAITHKLKLNLLNDASHSMIIAIGAELIKKALHHKF